ncbi:hypothetical protein [Kribbella sp. NPDC055071]
MEPIEEFVRLFVDWMDRTGAEGDPDLELIRALLEARRPVQDVFHLRDDMGQGVPGVMVWPNTSLYRTAIEVGPFSFPYDAQVREALIRTVPLLGAFIRMSLTKEDPTTLRKETADAVDMLTDNTVIERPASWARALRRYWLRIDAKFEPPPGAEGERWSARFDRMPWERRNELMGPIVRPEIELPTQFFGDNVIPRPTISLPSTLAAAARNAPLMADVIEVAEFLADRTGAWSGGWLGKDVVQEVLDGTSLSDPDAVQEAWRLGVLAGFLWPVPIRVFRGENLDLWSEPERAIALWTDTVGIAVSDLDGPLRIQVVELILSLYLPGPSASLDRLAAVRASADGAAAIDRLLRLGAIVPTVGGGVELTPLGIQGLLFRWFGWKPDGEFRLVVGEWQPDLTTADVMTWLRAGARGQIADVEWVKTADPQVFAGQLVDAMFATDDAMSRTIGSMYLSQLGSSVQPMVDRFAGTRLHSYRANWPGSETVRDPSVEELLLWLDDYLAFSEVWEKMLATLKPGTQVDMGNYDFPLPAGNTVLAKGVRGGALTAAEIAELRRSFTADRAQFAKLRQEIAAELPTDAPTEDPSDR